MPGHFEPRSGGTLSQVSEFFGNGAKEINEFFGSDTDESGIAIAALVLYLLLVIFIFWLTVVKFPIRFGLRKGEQSLTIGFVNFLIVFFFSPIIWLIGKLIETMSMGGGSRSSSRSRSRRRSR
jgi:hypothetical protein